MSGLWYSLYSHWCLWRKEKPERKAGRDTYKVEREEEKERGGQRKLANGRVEEMPLVYSTLPKVPNRPVEKTDIIITADER